MTYYKWLRPNRIPRLRLQAPTKMYGAGQWPVPGQWLSVQGELVPCVNGLHLCRERDFVRWIGPELWVVEPRAGTETIVRADKVVVREARLVRRVEEWNETTARHFACDCATYAIDLAQSHKYTLDYDVCRGAVELARIKALGGDVPDKELTVAQAVAQAVALAAETAARDAQDQATRKAAWAAWEVVWAAAWTVAQAAYDAAQHVAQAAYDAAQHATQAAYDVREAQNALTEQLLYYIGEG